MKKTTKKVISIFLSVLMLVSVMPLVFAAPVDEPAYATGYAGLGDYAAPALGEGGEGEGASASIPAQFSLVDKMPAARDQNPYGSCWAFGTIASVESNLITQGLASKDEIDLSEMQLIYYMYHPTVDPLGNITPGEGSYRNDGDLIDGGRADYAMNELSHWNGLAGEADHENFNYGVYGSNVDALEEDWDNSLATDYNDYIIKGYYAINLKDADQLKAAIIENGAAATGYAHYYNCIYSKTDEETGEYTINYYSGKNPGSDGAAGGGHAVAIVGWDDNYAKENFGGKYMPENDGAWLIRNSWGDDWGMNGYFWMSYEEKTMDSTAFIAIMQEAGAYDNNYFYDGGAMYYPSAKVFGAVNKFTAQSDEVLKAVSVVFPEDANVDFTVEIYKIGDGVTNDNFFDKAELVETTAGKTTFAGMYTVELDTAVALAAGERFAVAVRTEDPTIISYDQYSNHTNSWFVNNVTWEDDSSYFIGGSGKLVSMETRGVARIKAYTDVMDADTVTITADDMNICLGNTEALAVTVAPDTAAIAYTVADATVASIADGAVTGLAEGSTKVVAYNAADNVKATFTVTVAAHELETVEAVPATCTADGSAAYTRCVNCGKIFIDGEEATEAQIAALVIDAAGHTLTKTDAVEATDYTDGNIDYWYCSVCEKYFSDENGETEIALADTVDPAPYALTKVVRKEATCTKDGNVEYYIVTDKATGEIVKNVKLVDGEYVDFAEGETTVIPAAHTLTTHVEAVDASCVGDGTVGNIDYYQCAVCAKYFVADEVEEGEEQTYTEISYSKTIVYPKHEMTKTAAKAATCTEDGNVQYFTCSVCHRYYKYVSGSTELDAGELVIPAKGHDPAPVAKLDPTCTEPGYEAYYQCKNCNKLFSDEGCTSELAAPVKIDPLGHDYQSEVTLEPTCTVAGITTYTCSRCGDSYIEPIAATGHTFVDGTCTGCGLTEEEVNASEIAELGGPICEYCGKRHGTSWFADFLYAVHRVLKFVKDMFAKIG